MRLAVCVLSIGALLMSGSRNSFGQSPVLAAPHYPDGFSCPRGITVQTAAGLTANFQGADPNDPEVCVWDYSTLEKTKGHGRYLYQMHNLGDNSPLSTEMRDAYRELFPLAVGKTVRKLANGEKFNSSMRLVLTVERIVDMNIGSEIHRAWLVHQEGFGSFGNKTDIDNYYWLEVGTFALLKMSENVNGVQAFFDVISIRTH